MTSFSSSSFFSIMLLLRFSENINQHYVYINLIIYVVVSFFKNRHLHDSANDVYQNTRIYLFNYFNTDRALTYFYHRRTNGTRNRGRQERRHSIDITIIEVVERIEKYHHSSIIDQTSQIKRRRRKEEEEKKKKKKERKKEERKKNL